MNKKDKIQRMLRLVLCGLCLILTGCSPSSMAQESNFESAYENGVEEEKVNIYTSAASVIIESVDEKKQIIKMYMIDRNESRELGYNGATLIQDKYGTAMSAGQLNPGDIADVAYNSELERAGAITLSGESWSYESVVKYNLDTRSSNATIGDENYSISSNVLVFSDNHPIDVTEIIHQDVLTLRGKGHNIMSITVEEGHGYLNLENDEAVLGGWIEVGQTVIAQIAPDMLLIVPEGSYTVRITAPGIEETREVVIERNKETLLDLEDVKSPDSEKGTVIFEVTPSKAAIYLDDEKVDTTYPIKVPLGLHKVTASASGYDSLSQYFQIETGINTVKMDLEETTTTVSGNTIFTKEKEKPVIRIEGPVGVEVYQDNLYMGIAPVTYEKSAGEHVITLRKTGYVTRSHAIFVTDDDNDVTYSFPDLELDGTQGTVSGNGVGTLGDEKTTDGQTVSGNTVSGNSVSGNAVSGN